MSYEGREVFTTSSYGQTLTVHRNTPNRAYTSIRIESDDGQTLAVALLPRQLDALINCLQTLQATR